MVCAIRGKHSHFCIGQAQSIQCAVTQHMATVDHHHERPALTNTRLVNLPIKPNIGYPVGCVTKKWFSWQRNQPFKEDVSYCLGWLSVIVHTLVLSKAPFSDPLMLCWTPCWPPNCLWLVAVLPQGNVELHCELLIAAFFYRGCWKGGGKFVDMDESCFSRQKCNCGRLHDSMDLCWYRTEIRYTCLATVADRSVKTLPAIIKACILCLPSLRRVLYP